MTGFFADDGVTWGVKLTKADICTPLRLTCNNFPRYRSHFFPSNVPRIFTTSLRSPSGYEWTARLVILTIRADGPQAAASSGVWAS